MLTVTNASGFGAGGISPMTANFNAYAANTGSASTYTFSSQAIGTAATGRIVVVCIVAYSSTSATTVSSVTAGGTSCAKVVGTQSPHVNFVTEMWACQKDTGTTGDIVAVHSAGCLRYSYSSFSLYGAGGVTAYATDVDHTDYDPIATVAVPGGGVVVAVTSGNQGYNPKTFTWASPMTEGSDFLVESEQQHTSAHALHASTGSSVSPTANNDSGNSSAGTWFALAASWGP